MAFITGKTPQGNCGAVHYTGNGHYVCGPVPDLPGVDPRSVDLLNFYVKITGRPGETVNLDIQWPIFDENLCGWRKYKNDPFFTVAHHCVYTSTDELNWQRVTDVVVDEDAWTIRLRLTLSAPVCYVAVNYYYTIRMYEELRKDMAQHPWVEEKHIGLARDGQEILLYKITDPSVPVEQKQLIYLQGGQHCCEYGGMHLADAMLRYLAGGSQESLSLLKKYEFHITPVVSVADWAAGYKDELGADPNTVWDTLAVPEVRAVDAYLRALPKKPVLLLDAHNTRTNNHLIAAEYISTERVEQLRRFSELVAEQCDFMKPGTVTWSKEEKYANFKQYALQNFGYSFTVEISRFWLYNRALKDVVYLSEESFPRFASQLSHTIDAFVSGLPTE